MPPLSRVHDRHPAMISTASKETAKVIQSRRLAATATQRGNGYCDLDERAHGASPLMVLIETPCWLRAIGQISLNGLGDIAV